MLIIARLIDCAPRYENQEAIGEGIRESISEGVVKREDVFIISKLYHTCHRTDLVRPALEATLKELNLEYLGNLKVVIFDKPSVNYNL